MVRDRRRAARSAASFRTASDPRANATLGCVIRAGKATGGDATVTLKTSGRTGRLNATTKIRVPSARRVSFTVKVASFTTHGVRYRPTTVRGTARR